MYVQFCLALLALSSLTAAADPECEDLLKPLEDKTKVSGKWIFHVGTSSNEESLKELKFVNSSWIELSPISGSEDMTLRWGDKTNDGKCFVGSVNSTYSGNYTVTFRFNVTNHEHVGRNLETCPDCILWTDTSVSFSPNGETQRTSRNLYLFTKSGKLDDAHLEVFKKQAACLNFPSDFHFAQDTGLCPDEKEAAADVKEAEQ